MLCTRYLSFFIGKGLIMKKAKLLQHDPSLGENCPACTALREFGAELSQACRDVSNNRGLTTADCVFALLTTASWAIVEGCEPFSEKAVIQLAQAACNQLIDKIHEIHLIRCKREGVTPHEYSRKMVGDSGSDPDDEPEPTEPIIERRKVKVSTSDSRNLHRRSSDMDAVSNTLLRNLSTSGKVH